jgi:hypothetical protein
MDDAATWIVLGITAAGLVIAYVTYRVQRNRKRIEYVVTTNTGLLPGALAKDLEVTHSDSGVLVRNPALTIIRIVNTGDRAIEANDYETNLTVTLEGVDQIVSATSTATRPADLKPEIEIDGDVAGIKPVLINKEDMIQLQVLSAGKPSDVRMGGRVADVKPASRELPYPPGSGKEGEMVGFDWFMWSVLVPGVLLGLGLLLGPFEDDRSTEAKIAIIAGAAVVALVLYPMYVRYLVKRRRMWRPDEDLPGRTNRASG